MTRFGQLLSELRSIRFGQLLSELRSIPRWAKIAGEIVVAVGAIVGLVFLFFPGLKPQDCRGVTGAEFTKIRLERSVTRGAFLDLEHASKAGVPRERLKQPGKLVAYKLIVRNLKGKPLTLRTWVFFARGRPHPDPTLSDQLAATITPTDCTDEVVDRIWSPLPRKPGKYEIQLDLTRDNGSQVETVETGTTAVFSV